MHGSQSSKKFFDKLLSLFFDVWHAQNIVEKCHQFSSGGLVWFLTFKERLRIMIC